MVGVQLTLLDVVIAFQTWEVLDSEEVATGRRRGCFPQVMALVFAAD